MKLASQAGVVVRVAAEVTLPFKERFLVTADGLAAVKVSL
jgi:hypothetical protein